jgi:hypothetical protein
LDRDQCHIAFIINFIFTELPNKDLKYCFSSMFGCLNLGGVAGHYGGYHAIVVMYLGMALAQAWWFVSSAFCALAFYAVLFDLSYGKCVALASALVTNYFGAKNMAVFWRALFRHGVGHFDRSGGGGFRL